ncbi:hypothetical protein ES705_41120 [subsurface metagenome]
MTGSQKEIIRYRLARARDTYEDALILVDKKKWNSTINRLYYSAYYAVMALLLSAELKPTTHNGAKSNFSEHFIKKGIISKEFGKMDSSAISKFCDEIGRNQQQKIKFQEQ